MNIIIARVEGYYEQLGIEAQQPQFSWGFAGSGLNEFQTKYRLMVAKSRADLIVERNLQFDSGIVESDATIGIAYAGEPLDAVTSYFWKVQVWDQTGAVLESDIFSFVTGKLSDGWQGQWIGNGTAKPFYARRMQSIAKEIKEAYALVSGLGQFVFYINGHKVGDHEIDPGWTNYNRLVQYVTFDVKNLLTAGNNVFGLEVANGWYKADAGGRYFVKAPQMKFISRFSKLAELDGYQPFSSSWSSNLNSYLPGRPAGRTHRAGSYSSPRRIRSSQIPGLPTDSALLYYLSVVGRQSVQIATQFLKCC